MTTSNDVVGWLGPALDEMTVDQVDAFITVWDGVAVRFPDRDDSDYADAALSAGCQVILCETTLEDVAGELHRSVAATAECRAALTGALLATGGTETALAERSGVSRMTVRKALGK